MVKRKGGGKKQVLHLSQFLGDAAPVTPVAPPVWSDDCPTDLSIPGLFIIIYIVLTDIITDTGPCYFSLI